MALKSYHRETLNDNWYEERAAPLNGVLPHDNVKEYATITGTDFSGQRPTPQRAKPRMISDNNLEQALRLTAAAADRGFRSSLPPPDLEAQKRYLDSTHRTSFVNHFAPGGNNSTGRHSSYGPGSAAAHVLALTPAGGAGGRNVERGKAASGAMGEVYREHAEPQKDTHAQRSWLYSTDPMIVAKRAQAARGGAAESPERAADGASAAGAHKPAHFRRQSTSITTIPLSHRGVFVDDPE